MSLTYTGRIRQMDNVNRIAIPKQICETLGYEAGTPFEFYEDNGEGAVIIRPCNPNNEAMYHGNEHIVNVWVNAQVEAFAMFGYTLEIFTSEGRRVGSYDCGFSFPPPIILEDAFTLWKGYGIPYSYSTAGENFELYPIASVCKPFLWIMSTAPSTTIKRLAETYMDKFVY